MARKSSMSLISGVPVSAISSGRAVRDRIRSETCRTCCERWEVLMIMMPRKSRLIDRSEVVRLSQNSITGRKTSSTVSGCSSISRSCGRNPSASPEEEQQQRGGHPHPWREHGAGEDHGTERHDGFESVHGNS
jgi:hypothetical protein